MTDQPGPQSGAGAGDRPDPQAVDAFTPPISAESDQTPETAR